MLRVRGESVLGICRGWATTIVEVIVDYSRYGVLWCPSESIDQVKYVTQVRTRRDVIC
jgi:hypothetical protein